MGVTAAVVLVVTALHAHRAHTGVHIQASQVSGAWRTKVIMADDPEKIGEGGALRRLLRRVTMAPDGATMDLEFYVKNGSECERHEVVGRRTGDRKYSTDYSGENVYKVVSANKQHLAFYNENVDARGHLTHLIFVAGKGPWLTEEEEEKFRDLAGEMGIPSSSFQNVLDSDDCPE